MPLMPWPLVSAGRDQGDHLWECQALKEQLLALSSLFRDVFGVGLVRFKLLNRGNAPGEPAVRPETEQSLIHRLVDYLGRAGLEVGREDSPPPNAYYKGIQFKMIIEVAGREWEIADGGFVDWTQQLLEDKNVQKLGFTSK